MSRTDPDHAPTPTPNATTSADEPPEVQLERSLGGMGVETDHRTIPVISLADLDHRRAEVTDQLWRAAAEIGFFQLVDHGIPAELVDATFAGAGRYFDQTDETKAANPWRRELNAGWESKAQVRPSTGSADRKESYQITLPNMDGLWPDPAELPDFRARMVAMEAAGHAVAMRVLSCFADRLGFPTDHFDRAHDPAGVGYQCTLRLLRYLPIGPVDVDDGVWWAGAHTDYDCLTLLFQRDGESGLQVCPALEGELGQWTNVDPDEARITCNIGDMLRRWSDDQLLSTVHRVRGPRPGEPVRSRHSVAFFAQANKPVVIESPSGSFEPITAADFLQQRINANFTS